MVGDDLSVSETAEALGTSPQTVRALLRNNELQGRKQPWGSRYFWVVSRPGLDAFLAEHGRLDGQRRRTQRAEPAAGMLTVAERRDRRPFVLRPRGRATVFVIVVGVPLLLCYLAALYYPSYLWYEELRQQDLFHRVLATRIAVYVLVSVAVACFVAVNLAVALRRTSVVRTAPGALSLLAAALLTGTVIASSTDSHWQTFLLWRHRQAFGVADPIHGKDVGFFVFSLPVELLVWRLLVWLVVMTSAYVVVVYLAEDEINFRARRATFGSQLHLASLGAILLLVVAWRLSLERYLLELGQPSEDRNSFAGATYVDVNIRMHGFAALSTFAVLLALLCLAAPYVARTSARRGLLFVAAPGSVLLAGIVLAATIVPGLVQQYRVDPSPLLREQPYLERSIAATRNGLGLDRVALEAYAPAEDFKSADYPEISQRLGHVQIWDTSLLEARMGQLATGTPYFAPGAPVLDEAKVAGRRQLTVVSSREIDSSLIPGSTRTWNSDRLAYTHGLGLVRFSATDVGRTRNPRLLAARAGLRQPRIYFGNISDPATWVIADTRRPEVDAAGTDATPAPAYHYTGTGGIELSSWLRRTAFAVALGTKELLLSEDITPQSRLLLHRDVGDRLHALAPFIQWDSAPVPLTADGHVIYVVDGYTTSGSYPYSERMELGGSQVNYARASVRATVDAFNGRVRIYLTDPADPIARAWAAAFPSLFRPDDQMPELLLRRLRYPGDLFDTQATAYERYHTTRSDLFANSAEVWSRPVALAGSLEVAGNVDFDESDEDTLRATMQPGYAYSQPPGAARPPRLILSTYYAPYQGQNLVGTLSGWIDAHGRVRLAARNLPRGPVTLGPAQISRLVFATPRVSNLLGLRNLETRDIDTSSIDSVILGRPHLVFLPRGVIQVQSLFQGSRGPGAARLLGVTVYLNGRAGLGPNITSAVRQALNDPPTVHVRRPEGPVTVGDSVTIGFTVGNARREVVTIVSPHGRTTKRFAVVNGRGTVTWVPRAPGPIRVRVQVDGQDETTVADHTTFQVLSAPPRVRLVRAPIAGVVDRPVRLVFRVRNGVHESVEVSTRAGIVFARNYRIRDGTGVVRWVPETDGRAVVILRVVGHEGQTSRKLVRIDVVPGPATPPVPSVTLVGVPRTATVGLPSRIRFSAEECRVAVARIEGAGANSVWRFPCPATPARFTWTPPEPGQYLFTASARGGGTTVQASTRLRARAQ